MAIPVPASKLFISLLARVRSVTLVCNSALTVASSSLTDCSSSFEVSNSSLVDCSSSLTDCISSLEDLSSSLEVSNSSLAVWRYSSFSRSSRLRAARLPSSEPSTEGSTESFGAIQRTSLLKGNQIVRQVPLAGLAERHRLNLHVDEAVVAIGLDPQVTTGQRPPCRRQPYAGRWSVPAAALPWPS